MSNQAPSRSLPLADAGCAVPMVREPVTPDAAARPAAAFKALGDPVRLRLLSLIASRAGGEACVCELTGSFDLSPPTISHHLKVLREAGLVTSQRRGTWVYYRAEPSMLARLSELLAVPAELGAGTAA
ncbi:metalloregulator ArsR/SmtB family transcription factor [Glycomyces halotolerans]